MGLKLFKTRKTSPLTLSVSNFIRHLSSALFLLSNKLTTRKKFICKVARLNVNSVDPDETAHYEPSHLDLRCLQKPIIIAYGSERVLMQFRITNIFSVRIEVLYLICEISG